MNSYEVTLTFVVEADNDEDARNTAVEYLTNPNFLEDAMVIEPLEGSDG
jgi:hypothetical protein